MQRDRLAARVAAIVRGAARRVGWEVTKIPAPFLAEARSDAALPFHYVVAKEALAPAAGELLPVERAAFLKILLAAATTGPVVEVGTLFGKTTSLAASALRGNRKVITIDNFSWNPLGLRSDLHERLVRAVLREEISSGVVELLRIEKEDFYNKYGGPRPSVVFLDADHSYAETAADIDWAVRVEAEIVCGHDYSSAFPGVVRAVNERGGPRDLQGSLWRL